MHRTRKPVRKCHSCMLNMDDHCWLYKSPRGQWHGRKKCRAFENETIYARFHEWQEQPHQVSHKDLRREFFRVVRKTEEHYNHFGGGKQLRSPVGMGAR